MSAAMCDTIRQLQRAADTRSLYPPGHPSHGAAVNQAREVLGGLLDEQGHLHIGVMPEGMTVNGEPVDDQTGRIAETTAAWWESGICGVIVQDVPSPTEAETLLDALSARDPEAGRALAAQLDALDTDAVRVATLEYGNLVPQAAVSGESIDESRDLLCELVDASAVSALTADERARLLSILGDHEHLGHAMRSAVGSGASGGSGTAALDPDADEAILTIDGHSVEHFNQSSVSLAMTIQRLAELAVDEGRPRREAVTQLAQAVRQFDLTDLGGAYRADVVSSVAEFDALAEIASHFTVDEIVQIARSQAGAIKGEASATYRRMLKRVAPTRERLDEIIPALRQALSDDGVAEDVFDTTLGIVLDEMSDRQPDESASLSGTDPEVREARRSELGAALERPPQDDAAINRLNTCLELLGMPLAPEGFAKAADAFREEWSQLSGELRDGLRAEVTRDLLSVAGSDGELATEAAAEVQILVGEVMGDDGAHDMLASLAGLAADERGEAVAALASGQTGRELLAAALAADGAGLSDPDVRLVVAALVQAEQDDGAALAQLASVITRPECPFAATIIDATADVGGAVARRELTAALAAGDEAVRMAVVQAVGRHSGDLADVLVAALDDETETVACRAASLLPASDCPRAGEALLQATRRARRAGNRAVMEAMVRALGACRHQSAALTLIDILRTRGGVLRRRHDDLRAAAAEALCDIGTPGALRAVAECGGRREKDRRIRDLAVQAAARIAAGTIAEHAGRGEGRQ